MRNLDTGPKKDYGSTESTDCPTCGTGITAIVTTGPGEHDAAPCGHRISEAYIGTRRVATDGGQIRVQLGQVSVTLDPDDTVADLYEKATQAEGGFPPELEHTAVVRVADNSPIDSVTPEDYVPYDLSTVHHGDLLETVLVSADQQPVYDPEGDEQSEIVTDGGLDPCLNCGEDPERGHRCQKCGKLEPNGSPSNSAGREAMER